MEIWKDIVGYEGYYQVSNFGRVKGINRLIVHGLKTITKKERMLKNRKTTKGYYQVVLCKNAKYFNYSVHRLVAESFTQNTLNKLQINHINGIKTDNRLENLEWVTQSENIKHAHNIGLIKMPKHENHYKSKLSQYQIEEIRSGKHKQIDLAKRYGVHKTTISKIATNVNWR
jgi:hypothetical protein